MFTPIKGNNLKEFSLVIDNSQAPIENLIFENNVDPTCLKFSKINHFKIIENFELICLNSLIYTSLYLIHFKLRLTIIVMRFNCLCRIYCYYNRTFMFHPSSLY